VLKPGRRVRLVLTTLTAGLLACGLAGQTSAQSAAGSITGQVVLCRDNFAPVADSDALLQDVPSPGGGRQPASVAVPVPNVLVVVDGTSLSASTDAGGRFSLLGVPTARPLALLVLPTPGGPPAAQAANLVLSAGQTLDVGMLVLGGAGDAPCVPPPPDQTASPDDIPRDSP
jgi:hypothetical protein